MPSRPKDARTSRIVRCAIPGKPPVEGTVWIEGQGVSYSAETDLRLEGPAGYMGFRGTGSSPEEAEKSILDQMRRTMEAHKGLFEIV